MKNPFFNSCVIEALNPLHPKHWPIHSSKASISLSHCIVSLLLSSYLDFNSEYFNISLLNWVNWGFLGISKCLIKLVSSAIKLLKIRFETIELVLKVTFNSNKKLV